VLNLYQFPHDLRLAYSIFIVLCVVAQTILLVVIRRRHRKNHIRYAETVFEAAVLVQLIVFSLITSRIHTNSQEGFVIDVPVFCTVLRYVIFALIAALAAYILIFTRERRHPLRLILPAAVSVLLLPVSERFDSFIPIFAASLIFWGARSIIMCAACVIELKTSISEMSIKEGIDTLHSGIMFCRPNGHIVLINRKMRQIMIKLTGEIHRSGNVFSQILREKTFMDGCEKSVMGTHTVFRLPDETVWMFSTHDIQIKNKAYIQLSAADVTSRWNMTERLQKQNEELRRRSEELKATISNVTALGRSREILRAKTHAHDVLGQRLTLVMQAVRGGESDREPNYSILASMSQSLMDDLKSVRSASVFSPADEIKTLKKIFAAIGVTIAVSGDMPPDEEIARTVIEIISESVTNAVRHALATEIYVSTHAGANEYTMIITDNGNPPESKYPTAEGGGISGMREKLGKLSGTLSVTRTPKFVLTIQIPGGETK